MPTFRARARTVDLLGRQQIAGIPTAISELFKNAHDAYAENVEADFFRAASTLILRDDGLGMTPSEFVERWLTLGTDSKVVSNRGSLPAVATGRERRPILGEKGIGRLAIASIGPQVLVLTRATRDGQLSDLTVALINWRLFELPGINLDELDIPILEVAGGRLPTGDDLKALAGQVRAQLEALDVTATEAAPILDDLTKLDLDVGETLRRLDGPSLRSDGHGTQFVVTPTALELAADIDVSQVEAPPLVQTLIGFANTMLPDSPPPRIRTAFRDHREDDHTLDLIGPAEFFTPDDFAMADHRVRGRFDEIGDFRGSIQVYGGEARAYDFVWTNNGRRPTGSGPFKFDLAYVQGADRDTRLPPIEHARLTGKLDRIGGLYIYRDDIRVLPYGTPDFDFLGIERRRTQNLSRAFFSYRRMFGVVQLTSTDNRALQEKAGREGFIYNAAYRRFRDVLSDLFVDLAAEFFTSRGSQSEEFIEGREEARHRYQLRRERDKRAVKGREQFSARLATVAQKLREDEPQHIALRTLERFANEVASARGMPDEADRVRAAEIGARAALDEGRRTFSLTAPAGLGLTGDLRTDWDDVKPQLAALDVRIWGPTLQTLISESERAAEDSNGPMGRLERLTCALETAGRSARTRIELASRELDEAQSGLAARVRTEQERAHTEVAQVNEDALSKADAAVLNGVQGDALADLRVELEEQLREVVLAREDSLQTLATRVEQLALSNGTYLDTDVALLEEEVLGLRDKTERDLELAQIGMATEILTHELDLTIVSVRGALDRLGIYVDDQPRLVGVYNDLRTGFDHLDTYLSLFTPLQRRLTRRQLLIKGSQIAAFLNGLFGRRLESDQIELQVTPSFSEWRGRGFRSTLYPVFVNLVDNATYWTTQQRPPRWVRLDAEEGVLIVADSGPGVGSRDTEAIFEFGFTRKPGGRGAGLHIAQETLKRDGWDLGLSSSSDAGAVFRLTPPADVEQ